MPVDALVNAVPRQLRHDQAAARIVTAGDYPEFGSGEHLESLQLVMDLAEMRDTPLVELPTHLPKGLRVVSRYLSHVEVPKYAEGKDYGTTKASHRKIQEGQMLATNQQVGDKTTWILTGRDAASFVHSDDPVDPWERVIKDLLAQGIKPVMPESMVTPFPAQSDFTVYGFPFFKGLLGQALREVGVLDFHLKWRDALPRPEESAPVILDKYLPLAYAEGSPMHPRGPAMHSGAAEVLAEIIRRFWPDSDMTYTPMQDDDYGPVKLHDEIKLLADNIGYFRLHAGVHEEADHLNAKAPAVEVARRLTRDLVPA